MGEKQMDEKQMDEKQMVEKQMSEMLAIKPHGDKPERENVSMPASMPARQTIYLEQSVRHHPRAAAIIKRFNNPCVIECDNYREIFNPKRNNFRLQKNHPALIIARKENDWVQPSPYGIGGKHNFYFSHMLNCMYDCSYCFLQAMYSSAHYVIFINYEDFFTAIEKQVQQVQELNEGDGGKKMEQENGGNGKGAGGDQAKQEKAKNEECFFFSGYDCDSLAYEPTSKFVAEALPFFAKQPNAWLELRTKSVQVKTLLQKTAIPNCIVAFSMAPDAVARQYEKGTPAPNKRLLAMKKLAQHDWKIGARLDPLIWHDKWQDSYSELIEQLAAAVPNEAMHSITLGTLRFPRSMAATMSRHYPTAPFLVNKMITTDSALQMQKAAHDEMIEFCRSRLSQNYDDAKIIPNAI